MDTPEKTFGYTDALKEFYAGEVIGEAAYSGLIEGTADPQEQWKLAHLLQLETETKAWLRSHVLAAGLSVAEPASMREPGTALVGQLAQLGWQARMQAIHDLIGHFAGVYERYAEAARARGQTAEIAVCDFMVEHEKAQAEFARRELAGEPAERSLELLTLHSRYPLRG